MHQEKENKDAQQKQQVDIFSQSKKCATGQSTPVRLHRKFNLLETTITVVLVDQIRITETRNYENAFTRW